jgi:hypothetical protein
MIENIWILTKGGILLFKKEIMGNDNKDELIAGFLSASRSVITEATHQEMKAILLEGKKFIYDFSTEKKLIFVIITDEIENTELLQELLHKIKTSFLKKYGKLIENFAGETSVFNDFEVELKKLLQDSETSIRCQTCRRIIHDVFIKKNLNGLNVYFCCSSCEKYFSNE